MEKLITKYKQRVEELKNAKFTPPYYEIGRIEAKIEIYEEVIKDLLSLIIK